MAMWFLLLTLTGSHPNLGATFARLGPMPEDLCRQFQVAYNSADQKTTLWASCVQEKY